MANVTKPNQWQQRYNELLTAELPSSGFVVRIKPFTSLDVFNLMGEVPDFLTSSVVMDTLESDNEDELAEDIAGNDRRRVLEWNNEYTKTCVKLALASPRVVDEEPGDGEILYEWIDGTDRAFLVGLIDDTLGTLKRFRSRQKANLEIVQPDEEKPEDAA